MANDTGNPAEELNVNIHPADHFSIKNIRLENIALAAMVRHWSKTRENETAKQRKAREDAQRFAKNMAALEIAKDPSRLARLDHDHETFFNLFSDELATQFHIALTAYQVIEEKQLMPEKLRNVDGQRTSAIYHIGQLVYDVLLTDIEKVTASVGQILDEEPDA